MTVSGSVGPGSCWASSGVAHTRDRAARMPAFRVMMFSPLTLTDRDLESDVGVTLAGFSLPPNLRPCVNFCLCRHDHHRGGDAADDVDFQRGGGVGDVEEDGVDFVAVTVANELPLD